MHAYMRTREVLTTDRWRPETQSTERLKALDDAKAIAKSHEENFEEASSRALDGL